MTLELNRKYPVLVTGIGGGGHGEQILKALQLAGRYLIIGADANDECANRHVVDHFAVLPRANDPKYLEEVVALAKRFTCRAIFHGSEAEMVVLSQQREKLEALGLYVPVNPPSVMEICQDKAATMAFLSAQGVRVPLFREVSAFTDLEGFDHFPVVIKPSRGGGGSANVFIVQNRAELELFASYLLGIYESFILQEYVGTPNQEYTVGVLFGADGRMLNSIAIRRLVNNALTIRTSIPNRSGRAELGSNLIISTGISQGYVGDWPEVRAQCERIATALHPRAPINIQCRLVNDIVIPFEINPRFSGTTSLRAMVGYNEPDCLFRRDVLGEPVEVNFPYRRGLILRSLHESLVTP
ncbi:ATP-grasp domain-containing protein [Sedimenticola hydrogenitrophicus]|uniref:ATP-grasp domain-containing protein n=1 Tax=Sedimenticola hydrogenitrophicus TaxID=2967975 RepID=UPI0021A6AEEA|nr:ATP-grasp domain-containing protein [Sedimenticola hydrogenitrophicus]